MRRASAPTPTNMPAARIAGVWRRSAAVARDALGERLGRLSASEMTPPTMGGLGVAARPTGVRLDVLWRPQKGVDVAARSWPKGWVCAHRLSIAGGRALAEQSQLRPHPDWLTLVEPRWPDGPGLG